MKGLCVIIGLAVAFPQQQDENSAPGTPAEEASVDGRHHWRPWRPWRYYGYGYYPSYYSYGGYYPSSK